MLTVHDAIIEDLQQSPSPESDKELMKSVGFFIALLAANRWKPFVVNSPLSPKAVAQMEALIVAANQEPDRDNEFYGTITWATQWWTQLYFNSATFPVLPPGQVIPRDEFEAMLEAGELVEQGLGIFQIPDGSYVIIMTQPDGSGLLPDSEKRRDLVE